MSKDPSKEAATTPKDARGAMDMNAVELVFGTPNSPNTGFTPDVHSIANERRTGKSPTEHLNNNNKVNNTDLLQPSAPLLEPDIGRPKPPLAGPEVDDLDDKPADAGVDSFHGIDDGLLEPADKKPDIFNINGEKDKKDEEEDPHAMADEGVGTEDGKWLWPHDETDYPYGDWPEHWLEERCAPRGLHTEIG